MKCNPLRWLWGLFALLPLVLLAVVSSRSSIEADLTNRVQENFKRSGLGWANVVMEGREARITGQALEDGEPDKATQVAFDTWGIRTSTSGATLIEKVDKYEWLAERRDNRIRLGGYVPNGKTRTDIMAAAKAAFPTATIDDEMKIARGAPALDVWNGGINFGLKQLASLKSGQVKLEQTGLIVTGEANDQAAFRGVKTALSSGLPKGIQLKLDAVKAPPVRPYTWAAQHGAGQLKLTGYVPSQRDRDAIQAAAKSAHPKAKLVDEMQIGEGAPDGYLVAVTTVLGELANLEEGRADLRDAAMSIAGLAESAGRADGVRGGLRKVPASIKIAEQIKHREPPPPPPPAPAPVQVKAISPYRTSLFAGTGTVVLSGYVPSEETRKSLVEMAKQRFANRAIIDQLQIGAGQPAAWQKCLDAGFAAVQRLGNGRANLSDNRLEVSGITTASELAQALPGEVRSAVGTDCDSDVRINLVRDTSADEARLKAEAESRAKADAERLKAEAEARARADADRLKAEVDAKARAEADRLRLGADARARAEADRLRAETQRKAVLASCQDDLKAAASAGINFKRASAEIEQRSFATLNRLAELTARCPDGRIEVEGHTDADGTPERNQSLSERRARSVLDYLVQAGVAASRLTAIGYGETRNVAPNDTPENKARNRRIEFTVK